MSELTIVPNEYLALVWNASTTRIQDSDLAHLGLKKVSIFSGEKPLNETLKNVVMQRF